MASIPSTPWIIFNLRWPRRCAAKPILAFPGESEAEPEAEAADPVKLAFGKAQAYKKAKINSKPSMITQINPSVDSSSKGNEEPAPEVPDAVKLAMERAREYKKNRGVAPETTNQPSDTGKQKNAKLGEILENKNKKQELKVSSVDFMGLDFSEKKNYRGRPPGLVPVADPLEGDIPEVEIIVGDTSKFGVELPVMMDPQEQNDQNLYKPKVSSWGVFPRPNDISKTFGGGRTIQPGEVLETADNKAAKEKRTKDLIASYKRKMGLTVDVKTKSDCEMALKEGNKLMNKGKLREALPFYEKVMNDMVFQSELHGLAALQWSICQDSLRRSEEARGMYEKLQSHPNRQVSKRAKQFAFSFQAMEMMKVRSLSFSSITGYEDYFKAFVENNSSYSPLQGEQSEDVLIQVPSNALSKNSGQNLD